MSGVMYQIQKVVRFDLEKVLESHVNHNVSLDARMGMRWEVYRPIDELVDGVVFSAVRQECRE